MEMQYLDAYEVAKEYVPGARLRAQDLEELLHRFLTFYLESIRYRERIASNQFPESVKNEMLNKLRDYLSRMQNRPELIDHSEPGVGSYVCTRLTEMKRETRARLTLYDLICQYCQLCNRDLRTTMIHVAEYRSLNKFYTNELRKSRG